jgi:hypothetical protein
LEITLNDAKRWSSFRCRLTHPDDLPQFRWINTLLGNLKTGFSGTFHAFNYRYAGLQL